MRLHIWIRDIPSRHVTQGWKALHSPAAVQASRSAYWPCIYSIPRGCIPNTAPDLAWIRAALLVRLLLPGLEHRRCICAPGAEH